MERILEDEERARSLHWAVEKLDKTDSDLISMKYFYHYRNIDIAQAMNTDANDINGKIFRAKKKLRKILQKRI